MNWQHMWDTAGTQLVTFGLKVAGAILVWLVGRWLISLSVRLLSAALGRQRVDATPVHSASGDLRSAFREQLPGGPFKVGRRRNDGRESPCAPC